MNYNVLFYEMLNLWFVLVFVEYAVLRKMLRSIYPVFLGFGFIAMVVYLQLTAMAGGAPLYILVLLALGFPVFFLIACCASRRFRDWLEGDWLPSAWAISLIVATSCAVATVGKQFIAVRVYWYAVMAFLHLLFCFSNRKRLQQKAN